MPVYQQINELTAAQLTVSFTDFSDVAVQPTTVDYRIDSVGVQVVDWTSVTPGTSATITLSTTHNTLLNAGVELEPRRVTIRAGYGSGSYCYEQYRYYVKNLSGVT